MSKRTKTIRIPVVIDSAGNWAASYVTDRHPEPDWDVIEETALYAARENEHKQARHWVEVTLPLPEEQPPSVHQGRAESASPCPCIAYEADPEGDGACYCGHSVEEHTRDGCEGD